MLTTLRTYKKIKNINIILIILVFIILRRLNNSSIVVLY